jgi:hypothetical protein
VYGQSCLSNFLVNTSSLIVSLTAQSYLFNVTVANANDAKDLASTTVVISNAVVPKISIESVAVKYNTDRKVILTGLVTASQEVRIATWSCSDIVNFTTANLVATPLSFNTLQIGSTSLQLALSAFRLTAGLSYTIQLSASYAGSNALGSAS